MRKNLDIINLFDSLNISYSRSGKNVSEDHIGINCPFPGCYDPSDHLGVNLTNGYYSCWRNSNHSGRDIAKLLSLILKCSYTQAKGIVEDNSHTQIINTNVVDQINQIYKPRIKLEIIKKAELELNNEFMKITKDGFTKKFFNYFVKRGFFGTEKVEKFIKEYNVLCALTGEWRDRVIFPVHYNNKLVTWTSRSIIDGGRLPHRDLGKEESVIHIKSLIYNYDILINGGKRLFLVEGMFDCLKLNYYLPSGFKATCLTTRTIRSGQINLLKKISRYFDEIMILLDNDAYIPTFDIQSRMSMINNLQVKFLPNNIKDPGSMNEKQVLELI